MNVDKLASWNSSYALQVYVVPCFHKFVSFEGNSLPVELEFIKENRASLKNYCLPLGVAVSAGAPSSLFITNVAICFSFFSVTQPWLLLIWRPMGPHGLREGEFSV